MKKKATTRKEKYHMSRVADSGCLICDEPALVHHLQCFAPRNNFGVIGLCPEHHAGKFSIHNSKRAFQMMYGDDMQLLAQQIERLI